MSQPILTIFIEVITCENNYKQKSIIVMQSSKSIRNLSLVHNSIQN